jgi:hypothetical protein
MKSYKYSTKERAERVSETLGCTGSHYHNQDGEKKYMPCKTHEIFLSKTKNNKKSEEPEEKEVTELVDTDGTWLTSREPILDPASTVKGSTTLDKTVGMARNPRDPLLRGWYGYYGESKVAEEDMSKAFGYEDTKDMGAEDTIDYYEDELELDKDSAIKRAEQQGKKVGREDNAPKDIKKKKNFIDRLVLKEKDIDEDIIVGKNDDNEINKKSIHINPLLVRNIKSIKKMAKENGITIKELMKLIRDEQ